MELRHHELQYKDIFTISRGIFQFVDFDVGLTKPEMNILCYSEFGERYISPILTCVLDNGTITDERLAELGNIILAKYGTSWERIKTAFTEEYSVTNNYDLTESENVDDTSNTSMNSSTNEKQAIYGFQSDDSSDDTKTTNEYTDQHAGSQKRVRGLRRYGNIGIMTPQQIIEQELKLREKNFLNYVLNDLKEFSTLDVY